MNRKERRKKERYAKDVARLIHKGTVVYPSNTNRISDIEHELHTYTPVKGSQLLGWASTPITPGILVRSNTEGTWESYTNPVDDIRRMVDAFPPIQSHDVYISGRVMERMSNPYLIQAETQSPPTNFAMFVDPSRDNFRIQTPRDSRHDLYSQMESQGMFPRGRTYDFLEIDGKCIYEKDQYDRAFERMFNIPIEVYSMYPYQNGDPLLQYTTDYLIPSRLQKLREIYRRKLPIKDVKACLDSPLSVNWWYHKHNHTKCTQCKSYQEEIEILIMNNCGCCSEISSQRPFHFLCKSNFKPINELCTFCQKELPYYKAKILQEEQIIYFEPEGIVL